MHVRHMKADGGLLYKVQDDDVKYQGLHPQFASVTRQLLRADVVLYYQKCFRVQQVAESSRAWFGLRPLCRKSAGLLV